MTTPTLGDLIDKYKELETYVEAEDAAYGAAMKPYKDAINLIKSAVLAELQRTGQQNAKSENGGTAYQQTSMSVKVDNREQFLDFISQQGRWDMLDAGALKEPVKDWLDKNNGVEPPGLKVSYFTKCNIRRS